MGNKINHIYYKIESGFIQKNQKIVFQPIMDSRISKNQPTFTMKLNQNLDANPLWTQNIILLDHKFIKLIRLL